MLRVAQPRSPVLLKARNEILQLDCNFRAGALVYDDVFNVMGVFSHEEGGYAYIFFDNDPLGDGEVLTKRSPEHLVTVEDYKVHSDPTPNPNGPNTYFVAIYLQLCACARTAPLGVAGAAATA